MHSEDSGQIFKTKRPVTSSQSPSQTAGHLVALRSIDLWPSHTIAHTHTDRFSPPARIHTNTCLTHTRTANTLIFVFLGLLSFLRTKIWLDILDIFVMKWCRQSWSIYIDPNFKCMRVCECRFTPYVSQQWNPARPLQFGNGSSSVRVTYLYSVFFLPEKDFCISCRASFTFFSFFLACTVTTDPSMFQLKFINFVPFIPPHFPVFLSTPKTHPLVTCPRNMNAIHIVPTQSHWKTTHSQLKHFMPTIICVASFIQKIFYHIFFFFWPPIIERRNQPKTRFCSHEHLPTHQVLTSQQQEAQQGVQTQADGLAVWLKTFPTVENKLMRLALIA